MFLFMLGVLLGTGLILAIQGVARAMRHRKYRRAHATELEVQRRVDERLNPLSGWGSVPSPKPGMFVPRTHP